MKIYTVMGMSSDMSGNTQNLWAAKSFSSKSKATEYVKAAMDIANVKRYDYNQVSHPIFYGSKNDYPISEIDPKMIFSSSHIHYEIFESEFVK